MSSVKSNDPTWNWNFPPNDEDDYDNDDDDDDIGDDDIGGDDINDDDNAGEEEEAAEEEDDEEDVPTRRLISPTYQSEQPVKSNTWPFSTGGTQPGVV